ncbi:hypothetical protein FB446DRAFT_379366 [Lentinula raphanica]|nr:hypothetical protein FB446DRAFT_379366 [Lentinula raphanica]
MPFRLDAPQHNLKKGFQDECEMRNLRGSIQEELQPLSELKTEKEFAQVYFDVVQCHHWVYTYPKILHRDISDGNIMFREEEGKIYGVLNNWDLALLDPETESFPTSKFRTGTKPFLAHEQHSSIWIGPHRYRHDLELMFYVILLQTCLHTAPTTQASLDPIPGNHQYGRWHSEDDEYLGQNKHSLIHRDPWVPPVEGFFSSFSIWLMFMKRSLADGLEARRNMKTRPSTFLVSPLHKHPRRLSMMLHSAESSPTTEFCFLCTDSINRVSKSGATNGDRNWLSY